MGIAGAAATAAATAGGLFAQNSNSTNSGALPPAGMRLTNLRCGTWDSDMPQYISNNTDDEMSHGRLSQGVPDFQRREARGPGHVSHSAEQPGDRGAGIGTADQPDEPQCGHKLVHQIG